MALGGAWVQQQLGPNIVRFTGRTFGASADAAVLGLFGDAGVDTGGALPASFVGTTGDAQGIPTAALLQQRVKVTVNPITDPAVGATGNGGLQVVKTAVAPFQITLTQRGTPAVACQYEVYVENIHSLVR